MSIPIKVFRCPRCKRSSYTLKKERSKESYGEKEIEYWHYYYKCDLCGKEFVDRQTITKTTNSFRNAKQKIL